MRVLRPFLWAAILAAAFLYVTSVAHWDIGRALQPVRNVTHSWSEPATAEHHPCARAWLLGGSGGAGRVRRR